MGILLTLFNKGVIVAGGMVVPMVAGVAMAATRAGGGVETPPTPCGTRGGGLTASRTAPTSSRRSPASRRADLTVISKNTLSSHSVVVACLLHVCMFP